MKKQIRFNTFETNSSSVHTLQISKDLMSENEFCDYVNNHLNPNQRSYHCVGIKIDKIKPKYDYGSAGDFLDHQSCPYGSHDTSGFAFDFYDTDMLVNFIFNPYLWLQTDCD